MFPEPSLYLCRYGPTSCAKRTHEDVGNFSFSLLTPPPAEDRLNEWERKQHISRLSILNLLRQVTNLHRHVALQKRLIMYLVNNGVNGVSRVLSQSLRNGLSAKVMLHRLEQAFEGKYSTRQGGNSDKEFDVSILAMRLGSTADRVAPRSAISESNVGVREDSGTLGK